ncbi:MAG TPA: hypothetical protein VKA43_11780 [Gammaproteobacteria bacterium]|nr:hypothetical protein [Gammaproteobacteria bacterium]
MDDRDQELETLPQALVSRLKASDRAQPIVDPRTDRAVLDAARAYFAQRPVAAARYRRRFAMPLGAAAAVLLAVLVVRSFGPEPVALADDVDGSGRVDILDAFALARAARDDASGVAAARIEELGYRVVALDTPRRVP